MSETNAKMPIRHYFQCQKVSECLCSRVSPLSLHLGIIRLLGKAEPLGTVQKKRAVCKNKNMFEIWEKLASSSLPWVGRCVSKFSFLLYSKRERYKVWL